MALRVKGTIVVNDNRDVVDIVNVTSSGTVTLSSTTPSVSNLTGALIVGGGAGVKGSVWAGEFRTISSAIRLGRDTGITLQGIEAVAIGSGAGFTGQGDLAVAIGSTAGEFDQGIAGIAIGSDAGNDTQGDNAIAIGQFAGLINQPANSIIINASGATLNGTNTGTYISPIRNDVTTSATSQVIYYNTNTKEVTYAPASSVVGAATTVTTSLRVTNTTVSTSTTTGALIVAGGVGIGGKLYVGGLRTDATTSGTSQIIYYNTTTKELTYSSAAQFGALSVPTLTVTGTAQPGINGGGGALSVPNGGASVSGTLWAGEFRTLNARVRLGSGAGNGASTNSETIDIGNDTGNVNQGDYAIAIGSSAGSTNQGISAVAIGRFAGSGNLGFDSVAIGRSAAQFGQDGNGTYSVAIGSRAAYSNQGNNAVAIGSNSAFFNQGDNAIAIGNSAGYNNQPDNSIIINASSVILNGVNTGLYINPVRADATTSATSQVIYYNTSTKEVTYAPAGSVVGAATTVTTSLRVTNTTAATSTLTGALQVVGGAGIGRDLYVGGNVIAMGKGNVSTNSAIGLSALASNTTGLGNVATGSYALTGNTIGSYNTAIGYDAVSNNTTGNYNVGIGFSAGLMITTGSGNISIGSVNKDGLYSPAFDITTQNDRISMGSSVVTNAYIKVAWTVVSDARDKTDFAPVPHGLDFVSKLKPTIYRYKANRNDIEGHGPLRYGFKAQDVLELEGDTPIIVDVEDPEKLRFNDQSMIAVLVNAIQELKTEFDQYKATHP